MPLVAMIFSTGWPATTRSWAVGGNDTLGGGSNNDTAVFSGARSGYSIATHLVSGQLVTTVAGPDGTDTLTNIETLQFASGTFARRRGSQSRQQLPR